MVGGNMKNKLLLETFRTIRLSLGKYLMLMTIVLLGVSFFAGMLSMSPAMSESVDYYLDEYDFLDFQLYSNYGFDKEDLEAIQGASDDFIVEGGNFLDVEAHFDDNYYIFRLESLSEDQVVNQIQLVEGRLPEAANEALAEITSDLYLVPEIGDVVTVQRASMDLEEVLTETEFTIVGTVTTPHYMSKEKGSSSLENLGLDTYLYLPEEAFAEDYYTTVFVQSKEGEALNSFSPEYLALMEEKEAILEEVASSQESARADRIKSEAMEEYQDGLTEYEDGLAEFETEIQDAEEEIANGYAELEDGEAELEEGISQLESLVASGMAGPEQEAQLQALRTELEGLDDARLELEEAEIELEESKIEGEEELEEAKLDLEDALAKIEDLEEGAWIVLSRDMHYSISSYADTIVQMEAIGLIFPVFFFLVAALVCLTTMTRMIDEQRGQVGVLRALGYSRLACTSKYIIYALSATILGGCIGAVVGIQIFPPVVYNTWGIMYHLPEIQYAMPWGNMLLAIVMFLLVMGLTTFSAIRVETREVTSNLLRPKAPPAGKQIFLEKIPFLWKRFSFTNKVTARNIIRYKRRFVMTVLGISGCTCLLVSGFGLRGSIGSISETQFGELTKYETTVSIEEDLSEEKLGFLLEEINKLDESVVSVPITTNAIEVTGNGVEQIAYLQVFENQDSLSEMQVVRERGSETLLELADDSVLINEKLAELLDLNVGDEIQIEASDETIVFAVVGGIFEKYVMHEIYMSATYYESLFGEEAITNAILLQSEVSEEVLQDKVLEMEAVTGISFNTLLSSSFDNITGSMDIVILVIIISAAGLAFVVLGNLANINISERKREIATLKVLGFNHKETKDYIFKENMILTFFGALVGVFLGLFAHNFIITQVEMDFVMFGRVATWDSILYSVILTFVFSIIANRMMLGKLKKIDMIESLKSVE